MNNSPTEYHTSRPIVDALSVATALAVSPYIIPTSVRAICQVAEPAYTPEEASGFERGLIGGTVLIVAQIAAYGYAAANGYPEYIGIPIATNVASALFEARRAHKHNLDTVVNELSEEQNKSV